MAIPKGFYDKYSSKLPSKLTIANKFGDTILARIKIDDSGRPYMLTNSEFVCTLYGYKDQAFGRLTYLSRGNFKLFVPVSSHYFDKYGPFIGANDMESEAGSDDDELTDKEQSHSHDGNTNPSVKVAGHKGRTKFVKVQLIPKGLKMKENDANDTASDCNSVVGGYKR